MVLNTKHKKFAKILPAMLIIIILSISCVCFASAAVVESTVTENTVIEETLDDNATIEQVPDEDATISDFKLNPNYNNLLDNKTSSFSTLDSITVSSDENIDSIYLIFWDKTPNFTLLCGGKSYDIKNSFLHAFVEIPDEVTECHEVTITFSEKANLSDVSIFKKGKLPDNIQVWNQPHEKADLLLCATQYSNEHTLFAGIIPFHIANNYRVQVAFFTNTKSSTKYHEMLDGLWAVGLKNYPALSEFPESDKKNAEDALKELEKETITEDKLLSFQTELLRRFKPQVLVSHDLNGENGSGQSILNVQTLIKAIDLAKVPSNYPESALRYGAWDTPKVYFHLYSENQVTLNWDEPLDFYNGKTAFQVSQEGYKANESQQKTWFTKWLNGKDGNNTTAAGIETYSPCLFGLYRTTVGVDSQNIGFFENIISYDEQYRIEQEKLAQDRLQQALLEQEEQKKQEEESKRIESQRLESLKEESRKDAFEKANLEIQKQQALENQKSEKSVAVVAIIICIASVIALAIVLFNKIREYFYF